MAAAVAVVIDHTPESSVGMEGLAVAGPSSFPVMPHRVIARNPKSPTRSGVTPRPLPDYPLVSDPNPFRRASDDQGVERNTNPGAGLGMNSYPADERRISEVERGLACRAVVPMPPGESLAAGDAILFALAQSAPGQEPEYVKGGDCVRVVLTDVTDLEESDPVTGRALVQLSWEPLGQVAPTVTAARRPAKSPRPRAQV